MGKKISHTPGEWKFDGRQIWATDGGGIAVAANICTMVGKQEMRYANAHLIAAAPRLLEAVHALLDEHADCKGCAASDLAFQALALAEGRRG